MTLERWRAAPAAGSIVEAWERDVDGVNCQVFVDHNGTVTAHADARSVALYDEQSGGICDVTDAKKRAIAAARVVAWERLPEVRDACSRLMAVSGPLWGLQRARGWKSHLAFIVLHDREIECTEEIKSAIESIRRAGAGHLSGFDCRSAAPLIKLVDEIDREQPMTTPPAFRMSTSLASTLVGEHSMGYDELKAWVDAARTATQLLRQQGARKKR